MSLYACVFVCDKNGCKNNNHNLLQCGTSVCGLMGFEMLFLICLHLQFSHVKLNK